MNDKILVSATKLNIIKSMIKAGTVKPEHKKTITFLIKRL